MVGPRLDRRLRLKRSAMRMAAPAWVAALTLLLPACGGSAEPSDDRAATKDAGGALGLLESYREAFPVPDGPWIGIGEATPTRQQLVGRERELLSRHATEGGPEVERELGLLYTRAGETARGMAFLTSATLARPGDALAWGGLGTNRLSVGEFDTALTLLDHALTLAPDAADLHIYRAETLRRLGDDERARGVFERAIELDPGRADARVALASLLEDADDLDGARRELELAAEVLTTDQRVPYRLARIARAQGRDDDAERYERDHARLADLDDLGLLDRGLAPATQAARLGIHYLELERSSDALDEFDRCLALDPEGGELVNALYGRVRALLDQGDDERATEALARLREEVPDHPALPALDAEISDAN